MSTNKITTIRVTEETKNKFRTKFKEFPRETDEDILIKITKDKVKR